MKRNALIFSLAAAVLFSVFLLQSNATQAGGLGGASMAEFDRRARAQEPLTVVFFGGSLTWGANASDPQRTSYRALFSEYLRLRYPRTSFRFVDASIGGTDSKLAMFRLERDVLARHPDLVLLEFTASDGLEGTDRETLASYERLIHELASSGIPLVQVLLGYRDNFEQRDRWALPPRARDHVTFSKIYRTALADGFSHVNRTLSDDTRELDRLWPFDDVHPDDAGYRLYFEAVREAFEASIRSGHICRLPLKPVYADLFRTRNRIPFAMIPIPDGWHKARPYRTSLHFDGLPSRWLDEVIVCDVRAGEPVEPLHFIFSGRLVGILGEGDQDSLGFRVSIDGELVPYANGPDGSIQEIWPTDTRRFGGGRMLFWHEISDKLKPGTHSIQIEPVFSPAVMRGQLRLESICFAGD
jgi:lysophospholipase L1-like esterase